MAQPYVLLPVNGNTPADEWTRLGLEAQQAGKWADVDRYYRQALRLDSTNVIATQNLAIAFCQQGNLVEGLITIERAALWGPKNATVWSNWALMAMEAHQMDIALRAAHEGVRVDPTGESLLALAMILTSAGRAREAIPHYDAVLARHADKAETATFMAGFNGCFVRTLSGASPEESYKARVAWYEANRYTGSQSGHKNDLDLARPLKVGYVGGDFKRHSAAFLFQAVVLTHHKDRIIPYCYSSLAVDPAADPISARFQAETTWRDISTLDDPQADELIRKEGSGLAIIHFIPPSSLYPSA